MSWQCETLSALLYVGSDIDSMHGQIVVCRLSVLPMPLSNPCFAEALQCKLKSQAC